ncbi:MAG: hypothetical protein PHH83_01210 [Patescibacteria group bacterium]|nr:hypothetical protein [Patescibacteria group bacterium]
MKKNIFLILKILTVCIVLILIVISIVIYFEKQNRVIKPKNQKQNNGYMKQVSQEELRANYKSGVLLAINNFKGNYEETRNKLSNIIVPSDSEFMNLHINLITAFDSIIYRNDKQTAKQRLEEISSKNDWLTNPLSKIIQSIQ